MEFARIKRITAAVVVDGKYELKKETNGLVGDEVSYVPLDQTQIDAITSLVKQSIGVDDARGDLVTVRNFEFQNSKDALSPKNAASKTTEFFTTYIKPVMPALKYLLVAIILFVAYKKVILPFADRMLEFSREEEEFQRPVLDISEDEGEDLIEKVQQMRKKVEGQLGIGDNFSEDDLKYDVVLEKIREITEERPEEVASLIQTLINEETPNRG
jgi:flagellar M-ring protein FliF